MAEEALSGETTVEPGIIRKEFPMSEGKTTLRKKKPRQLAIINDKCTGCAGSPVCVDYCPVEMCMFWVPDPDAPPFGIIEVDKSTCIGCARCMTKGPEGMQLDGCPWDAIEMVDTKDWEVQTGVTLPDKPEIADEEWDRVSDRFV